MRWIITLVTLLITPVFGLALVAILLANEPQSIGQERTTYRVFAVLAGALVCLTPLSGIALTLSISRQRWIIPAILFLVLPTLSIAAGTLYTILKLLG